MPNTTQAPEQSIGECLYRLITPGYLPGALWGGNRGRSNDFREGILRIDDQHDLRRQGEQHGGHGCGNDENTTAVPYRSSQWMARRIPPAPSLTAT